MSEWFFIYFNWGPSPTVRLVLRRMNTAQEFTDRSSPDRSLARTSLMEISPAAPPFIVGLQQVNGLHHIMIWDFHHSAAPLPAGGEGESVILHPAKKTNFFSFPCIKIVFATN